MLEVRRRVLGHDIAAYVSRLDSGINILLVGGSRTHIGSVSFRGGESYGFCREGHKDHLVSDKMAETLFAESGVPVCVECGIHYESPSKSDLILILSVCDNICTEILEKILEGIV